MNRHNNISRKELIELMVEAAELCARRGEKNYDELCEKYGYNLSYGLMFMHYADKLGDHQAAKNSFARQTGIGREDDFSYLLEKVATATYLLWNIGYLSYEAILENLPNGIALGLITGYLHSLYLQKNSQPSFARSEQS